MAFLPPRGQGGGLGLQQAGHIGLPLFPQGQQFEVGVRLLAGLDAFGPPDFQLVAQSAHGPLALAGQVGQAEHDRLGLEALLQVERHQLFHLAVGQSPREGGLGAVDQAGDHGVGAGGRGDLGPAHGGGGGLAAAGGRVLVVAFQQAGPGPVGQGALGGDAAAQLQVGAELVGVGDAGGQHIQSHPDAGLLGRAQPCKDQLRYRDGVALLGFQAVDHPSPSSPCSAGGAVQGSQSRMDGADCQRSGSLW